MAFDLETAFNKFQGDVMNKLSEQDDKIKRMALVKKTGAVPNAPYGTPHNPATPGFGIRRSNDPAGVMNSKGFSFAKVLLHVSNPRQFKGEVWCPNEMAVMDHFTKSVVGQRYSPETDGFGVAPIFPEMLSYGSSENAHNFSTSEILGYKAYIDGGTDGTDQGEIEWLTKTFNYGQKAAANVPSPTQAAFADASLGGSLIGPPTFGSPIELLRNVEALMNAGATTMPIGPTGSFLMPKLVAPTVATLVGENKFVTPTTYQTGQIELRAKKIMALVIMPGELLRFGGPGVEMLTRNDMMKSVALGMDYQLLFGAGANIAPLGLFTMAANTSASNGGIYVVPTAGVPGRSGYGIVIIQPSNANQLSPQDIYDFEAGIEQNNGEANGYIMAPTMFAGFRKARWTPYSGGTSQGAFTFDLTRLLEGTTQRAIDGRKVTVTNQIPTTMLSAWTGTGSLSGGTYTNLLAGDFTRYVITLFGGIEFAQETGGIQLFGADQVAVRALASFDGAPQYPGLFAWVNPAANISPTLAN